MNILQEIVRIALDRDDVRDQIADEFRLSDQQLRQLVPCKHEWTVVAPEYDPESFDPETAEIWSWCIRCGALSLGNQVFTPGPHQKHKLV